jgi:nucleoside-diphosphate-sugar epimerase
MHTKTPAFARRASEGKPAVVSAAKEGWPAVARRAKAGKPRLLIVGCGDVGLGIVARLKRRFRVFATTSSPQRCGALRQAGAVPIVVDLDAQAVARLAGLASRLICLVPPPPRGTSDARAARLLQILRRPPQQLVYVSTTGVYGDRQGLWTYETTPPAPITERARRRIDAERRMRAAPWRASVLRVPGIYGPGRLPIERLRLGLPAPVRSEDVVTNHIHAEDLTRICIASLFRARPRRIYNAVDDSSLPLGEYLDLVADRFGLPRAPRLPREALRQAVSPMQFSFMQESRRLANRRIKSELRVRLQYPTVGDGVALARVPAQ